MLKSDEQSSDLMTVKEAAAYLRVHRSTIYRLLQRKSLPGAFRIGSDWRIHRAALDEALQNLTDLSYQTPQKGVHRVK
jgi:excisionase family DNA binding protein